ncbi:MAG: chondroitinase family polysaccharide lyase, partial [Parvibaculales bacterium]
LQGNLERSARHYKDGKTSLHWRWKKPAPLLFENVQGLSKATDYFQGGRAEKNEPRYIPRSKTGGMKLWVYRERANPHGVLHFGIGSDAEAAQANPKYQFAMRQNFTGWRALWVHFEEDAKRANYKGGDDMKALAITPSPEMENDEVYFDLLQFLSFMTAKRHSDLQYENKKKTLGVDTYKVLPAWKQLNKFQKIANRLNGSDIEEGMRGLTIIERRLDYLLKGPKDFDSTKVKKGKQFDKQWEKKLKQARKRLALLNIKRKGDVIAGAPLFSSRDEQTGEGGKTFQLVSQSSFPQLALEYAKNPTDKKRQLLLDALHYFMDQGWAAGSSLGTVNHIIRINPYAVAVFLMRDELTDMNKHHAALAWYTRSGNMIDINPAHGENTDHIRGGSLPKLISILLMKNGAEKIARMNSFRDYLIYVSAFAPGFSDTIKKDYSIYHHRSAYHNAYGTQSLTMLAIFDWLLRDTAFALPQETTKRLKDSVMAQFNLAGGFELHPSVSGRFPYKNSGIDRNMLPAYAFLGVDENGTIIDEQLAASFAWAYNLSDVALIHGALFPSLSYYGTFGTLDLMHKAYHAGKHIKWAPPSGFFSFPYAGAATHKRQGWAASVRGFSKYIWDWESGHRNENPYGRYLSFGSLLLMTSGEPLTLTASGIDLAGGFHWGYAPGATTKLLPMEEVTYDHHASPKYSSGHHRNFTDDAFLGSVSLGDNGFFAMSLHDTVSDKIGPLFDDSFRVKKSYFFIDNEIIMLGSGISNNDSAHNTITTLFQHKIEQATAPMLINGEAVKKNSHKKYNGGFLKDPQGNYYILPADQSIIVEHSTQHSLIPNRQIKGYKGDKKHIPISAPHLKAWIDHGKAPKNNGYEYQILVQGNRTTANQLKEHKNYTVHQKDEKAHIIEHLDKNIFAYALFEADSTLPGYIKSNDTPILVMAKQNKNNLSLSITDPDLRLGNWANNMAFMPLEIVNQPAGDHIATLRIKGAWKLKQAHKDVKRVRIQGGDTILKIRLDHGLTRELLFSRY